MGVNSHQMSIVWCLTRKGMKISEGQIDDEWANEWVSESMIELMMKWVIE